MNKQVLFEKDRHLPIVYFEVDSFSFHNVQVIFWYFLMLCLMLKSLPQVGKVLIIKLILRLVNFNILNCDFILRFCKIVVCI